MIWIVIIAVIFLSVAFPDFAKAILVLGGSLIFIVGMIYFYSSQKQENEQKIAKSLISTNEVVLLNTRLRSGSYSDYEITGEVKNNSYYNLDSFTLKLQAYDCPTEEITNSCVIIGDTNLLVNANVPPQQVRSFKKPVYFTNLPQVKNKFVWSRDMIEVTGSKK